MRGTQKGGSPPPPTAGATTETVSRPDPGLARGKWEAPAWAFWLTLALILIGAGIYVAARMGALGKIFRKSPPPEPTAPVSRRSGRP